MIKTEKRIPFGFRGEWGKVYKKFVYDDGEEIDYQNNSYSQMENDVQFKYLENGIDKSFNSTQPIMNMTTDAENRVVKTTDAYFNDKTKNFECVVSIKDIVFLFGCFWVVEKIDERSIYTPNKQTFYYCGLKRIYDYILRREQC